jgi:small subunit ribosomal protein S19e
LQLDVPSWADLVKTSNGRELAPYNEDWFYVRCGARPAGLFSLYAAPPRHFALTVHAHRAAALARHLYLRGGVGIGALRKVYGGIKGRGNSTSAVPQAPAHAIVWRVVPPLPHRLDLAPFAHLAFGFAEPSRFARCSGSVIRKALQALETIKVVEKCEDGYVSDGPGFGSRSIPTSPFPTKPPFAFPRSGRRITRIGQRDLDRIAIEVGGAREDEE